MLVCATLSACGSSLSPGAGDAGRDGGAGDSRISDARTSDAQGSDGGTGVTSTRPGAVSGLGGIRDISASQFDTCAVVADGTADCWGLNSSGELGSGMTGGTSAVPLLIQIDW